MPDKKSALFQRILTAIPLAIVIISLIFFHPISLSILFGIICLVSIYELSILRGVQPTSRIFLLVIGALIYAVLALRHLHQLTFNDNWIYYVAVASALFLLFLTFKLLSSRSLPKGYFFTILLCLFYISIPLGLAQGLGTFRKFDPFFILYLFLMIWSGDIAAYFIGKYFGKRKLYQAVSPNKTIEGAAAALVFTLLCAFIISHFSTFLPLWMWLSFAFIVWLFGMTGDLVESMMKRSAGIKDSGSWLPGHGGFLDRFDSFIFMLPFVSLLYIFYFKML